MSISLLYFIYRIENDFNNNILKHEKELDNEVKHLKGENYEAIHNI